MYRTKAMIWVISLCLLLFLQGCDLITSGVSNVTRSRVEVSILYGSEKEEWLEPLVQEYNQLQRQTSSGSVIVVKSQPMGSIESARGIIEGYLQPTVWSPASSIYVPLANAEWRKTHSEDLVTGTPNDLVLSPVVIAMWRPMAEALGWPEKAIGWADIAQLSISEEGWAAYGYPEWGSFKLGHTHPDFSNSGIVSIISEVYAGLGKQRGLNPADLSDPALREFMETVESSIIHYGSSTGFFGNRMFENGPSYLSAAVIYENLVVAQESKRIAGQVSQIPVVAIYPKEGTFFTNNPYIVLNAPWVTSEMSEAARDFESFLLAEPQQRRAMTLGFRPADPSIGFASPLDTQHGIDTRQPQTLLEIPSAEVIGGIVELWRQTKKPVDVIAVLDISGSMRGEKINTARTSLIQFIDLLQDRDRLQIVIFSDKTVTMTELSELGPKREDIKRRVAGIIEGGGTSLYDATIDAHLQMLANGNPNHIRAIVVLSDGEDTQSTASLRDVVQIIAPQTEEGGDSIKLFTIAFGSGADKDVLRQIAEPTGGRQYDASPDNIREIYSEIATFF